MAVPTSPPSGRCRAIAVPSESGELLLRQELFVRQRANSAVCTTPITAARVALSSLGARRVALLTPYLREITESMKDYLTARGVNMVRMGSFEHSDENEVARIDVQSVRKPVLEVGRHDDIDAVFVSCTSVRLADQVAAIERELGKPVTSSNHAMAWHALRLGGVEDELPQFGRLFTVQSVEQ